MVKIKRVYEKEAKDDGYRVLVDRLWPRGIKKTALHLDDWAKDLAPTAELRKFFAHNPDHWVSFRQRYKKELRAAPARDKLNELATRARKSTLTLLYAARDEKFNNAVVLKEELEAATH